MRLESFRYRSGGAGLSECSRTRGARHGGTEPLTSISSGSGWELVNGTGRV